MPTLKDYITAQRTQIELDALAEMQSTLREIGKRTLADIDNQPDDHQHAYSWELVETSTEET